MNRSQTLIEEIEALRATMVQLGLKEGFSHKEVIQLSQQLDRLLNTFSFSGSVEKRIFIEKSSDKYEQHM